MAEVYDDYDDYLNKLYKQYYKNILKQMEQQGFSKVKIAVQKMMFEKRETLFDEFCDRYDFDRDDDEIVFTPEWEWNESTNFKRFAFRYK